MSYRTFDSGPDVLAAEIAGILHRAEKNPDELSITIEGVHTGKLCHVRAPRRATVTWLSKKGQAGLGGHDVLRTGPFSEFRIRWVIVDIDAEEEWRLMYRSEQRHIHALVQSENGIKKAYTDRDRLEDLGVRDGSVFHLYGIEDERYEPMPLCAPRG